MAIATYRKPTVREKQTASRNARVNDHVDIVHAQRKVRD